jgi:hypothetical protein
MALPISSFFSQDFGLGRGERPPAESPSHIEAPGDSQLSKSLVLPVSFSVDSSSGSYQVCLLPMLLELFPLVLLLLLFVLECPGGAFDKRELCLLWV